jgi:putative ubiquitin-RnfH superfamily antitoxin RatB of RatAB toxin-antitoxin module
MAAQPEDAIHITVCHAMPGLAWQRELILSAGATAGQALAASGFSAAFPAVDPWLAGVGVHGHVVAAGHVLRDGDRVEVYRPLVFDPMESRRRRAAHKARKMPTAPPPRIGKARR